jgi:hypothetical protein
MNEKNAILTAATHRCTIVCREHVDISREKTHAYQLNRKYSSFFVVWLSFQAGYDSSENLAPLSQVVASIHILS